tara:strand:+ start:80 stop:550 length:471 start_codon:yes stop_codon:yes gene_type:complete
MIIICPCGKKKFEVDSNLIPEKGKLLQCGSCDQTWFFNKNDQKINEEIIAQKDTVNESNKIYHKPSRKKNEVINDDASNLNNKKGSELVKYQPQFNFSFIKILSYLIVIIISFVAVIIILDTFRSPLYNIFPNLEFLLYNLFETLKDITLFIKDLI